MKSSSRTVALVAGFSLAAAAAWSQEFEILFDAEVNGFAQGILSAEPAVAPDVAVTNATGSWRVTLKPSLGDNLSGLFAVEGWMGEGFDQGTDLLTLEPVNADIDLDEAANVLTEAYVSARLPTGDFDTTISVGKVDVSGLFDVSDVAGDQRTQFFHPSFRNSRCIVYPGGDDTPRSLAAWVELVSPSQVIEGTVGWAQMDEGSGDSYIFAEGRFLLGGRSTVGVYFWQASNADRMFNPTPASRGPIMGFGGFADYELPMTGDLRIFGRLSLVDQTMSTYKASWSLGAEIGGSAWGRPNDTVGGAFGLNALSDDYAGVSGLSANEGVLEGYYRLMLLIADRPSHMPSIEITPNVQMIVNAGGTTGEQATLIWGLRLRSIVMF